MRVQLVHPPVFLNVRSLTALRPSPPLGLAYVAAALREAEELGHRVPGARILDAACDDDTWRALAIRADPEAVAFANRDLERRWQGRRIGYG